MSKESIENIREIRHDILSDLGSVFGACEVIREKESVDDEVKAIMNLICAKKQNTFDKIDELVQLAVLQND